MSDILVVQDALCPGRAGDRVCGNDLGRHAIAACGGKALPSVRFKCPLCLNTVTIRLDWQLVPVSQRPEVTAD